MASEDIAVMATESARLTPAPRSRWQILATCLCVAFGLAMLANTQVAGEGNWFWYATFLRGGKRLYADMHLAMQPLFVLETGWFLGALGKGWLASKVPAVLHVIAYCVGLLLLLRRSRLSDGQRAIVLGCAFFVSICFEAYRFDDYHVLADCFELYSLTLLLSLQEATSARRRWAIVAALGVLSGLAITTRLNDGAALLVGVGLAIICMAPAKRVSSAIVFAGIAMLSVLLVVRLTGDTLHDYATYSIFRAAGSKGGTGSVLAYPLKLPLNTLRWLRDTWYERVILYLVAVGLSWTFLLRPLARSRRTAEWIKAALGVAIILLPLPRMIGAFRDVTLVMCVSAVLVLLSYALGVLILGRFSRWVMTPGKAALWDRRQILFLIPLGQLASSSMSSGGVHMGLYGPIAVMIVVVSVATPFKIGAQWRSCLLTVATLMMCSAAYYKTMVPYSWHSYYERPMFVGRQWYRHPVYGPMIVDSELLRFIQPVCDEVGWSGDGRELLSLPFPYANYFCSIAPWHGYVQTFFDTSTKATIDGLMQELGASPPEWIFYQRQLNNLTNHEAIYNRGNALPHRFLDRMIEDEIGHGDWRVVYASAYLDRPGWSSEWILMRTR